MRRLRRAVGLLPPLVALASFVLLGAAALGPLMLDAEPPSATEHQTVCVCGAVPDAWLDGLASLRATDAAAALRQLALAESQLGVAPPPLLRARLHAALQSGEMTDAE